MIDWECLTCEETIRYPDIQCRTCIDKRIAEICELLEEGACRRDVFSGLWGS